MMIEVFKLTQDEWYGSYKIFGWHDGVQNPKLVAVTFCGNISPHGDEPVWRVCVWGNDDFGLEFDSPDEQRVKSIFLEILEMKYVNQQDLRDLGFISA